MMRLVVRQTPDSLQPPARDPLVLVVDDRPATESLVGALRSTLAYDIRRLADPREVESYAEQHPPDVMVIRDRFGSGESGINLCRRLRVTDWFALTPVVLISDGQVDETTVLAGLTCGADDYITHQASPNELAARIEIHLRNQRDRALLRAAIDQRQHYRDEAHRDSLTGIANRRACDSEISAVLQTPEPVTLVLVDADHFKAINDEHGHQVGDEVLRDLAVALEKSARRGDLVARFGGEEFAIVARGVGQDIAPYIGERFRAAAESMESIVPLTVSVGCATSESSTEARDPAELIALADEALYQAKEAGRNCVRVRVADQRGRASVTKGLS